MERIQVCTSCGIVEGYSQNGVRHFLGIPYARAERFAYPREVTSWEGILSATKYGPAPIQERAYRTADPNNPNNHYEHEFYQNFSSEYSEDCLNLNIWAPENAHECPVLIIIYGGGLVSGQNNSPENNGASFAMRGIVTVAMNYRLNVFGFLALKELEDADGKTGNYGYYDQQMAITWIYHNIRSFGGNPENMTLIGQSAGAACCETQIKSPLNKGLFRQAIIQSSAGFATFIKQKRDNTKEYDKWKQVYEKAGCRSIDELRSLPAKELYTAFSAVSAHTIGFCNAVYDENFTGPSKNAPCGTKILVGITSEDVMPLILYGMCRYLAHSQKKYGIDTYAYYFNRHLPGDKKGAWHGSDLLYLYGGLSASWRPFTSYDHVLSNTMLRYMSNFIHTGNPNGSGLPHWSPLRSRHSFMVFGDSAPCMGTVELGRLLKNTVHSNGIGM